MRLPRMTTRRWMIVVVIAGLTMGGSVSGVRLKRWRDHSLFHARFHSLEEQVWRGEESRMRELVRLARHDMQWAEEHQEAGWQARHDLEYHKGIVKMLQGRVVLASRMIEYHTAMAGKYRRATRYPWLPVEPDPPESE